MNNRDSGCVADVRPGILIDDRCYLKFSGDVKNISAVEQDRVLVFAALPTFEPELAVQVHQLAARFLLCGPLLLICEYSFNVPPRFGVVYWLGRLCAIPPCGI